MKKRLWFFMSLMVAWCVVVPVSAVGRESIPSRSGVWLYVGGSGPGNYTRIQDAINDSHDGDTVFVYDDASPYHETLTINTGIRLIGESTATTILDGDETLAVMIWVLADDVLIRNFTIKNSVQNVIICADDVTVMQTVISDANMGINLKAYWIPPTQRERIQIIDNCFSRTYFGIMTDYRCNNSIFQGNMFEDNDYGIVLYASFHNTILRNTFRNNSKEGIHDSYGGNNKMTQNTLIDNARGMEINGSWNDTVRQNNFIRNGVQAVFAKLPYWEHDFLRQARYFNESYVLRYYHVFGSTTWDANYWNGSLTHPYLVRGWSVLWHRFVSLSHIPRFEVDWHPATLPYDY